MILWEALVKDQPQEEVSRGGSSTSIRAAIWVSGSSFEENWLYINEGKIYFS